MLVVFQGTDAYVTPSWYETKRETGKVVPTWNYAIVQVRGTAKVIDDQDWLAQQIADLTASQEGPRAAPWSAWSGPTAGWTATSARILCRPILPAQSAGTMPCGPAILTVSDGK